MKVLNSHIINQKSSQNTPAKKVERGVAVETTVLMFFSLTIGIAGAVSLARLIPYHNTQKVKLQELRTQVRETETRVVKLRKELHRNFDPQKTQSLVEEYSPLNSANRVRIFFTPEEKP